MKNVLITVGVIFLMMVVYNIITKSPVESENIQKKEIVKKPKASINEAVNAIRDILTSSGLNVSVTGQMTGGGRAIITIKWNDFNSYSMDMRKDMLHGLMNVPLSMYEGGGHEIIIRNAVREVAKVSHSSWSGVSVEFY